MDSFSKKSLAALFVVVSLLCIWLVLENSKLNKQLNSFQGVQTDSLQLKIKEELQTNAFVYKTMLDRYEITLDLLKERDSLCANKFESILYSETE